jgi:hypothetical protein
MKVDGTGSNAKIRGVFLVLRELRCDESVVCSDVEDYRFFDLAAPFAINKISAAE